MSRIRGKAIKRISALFLVATLIITLNAALLPTLVGGRRYKFPWNLDMIDVEKVSPEPYDGSGVYIALLDTGLHEDYKRYLGVRASRHINTELARNFVDAPSEGDTNYGTTDDHGTVMASIILGYKYHGQVQGVAPGATVIPIRVLPSSDVSGEWDDIANALKYVYLLRTDPSYGIQPYESIIVSMSLGGLAPGGTPGNMQPHLWFSTYVQPLIDEGVIVVAAAGNHGKTYMDYPAAWPEVISVGAVEWDYPTDPFEDVPEGEHGEVWEHSSRARTDWGQQLDVVAPGVKVFAPPVSKGNPASYDGTSASAAHVSGTVALILQKDQSLDQGSVETILKNTALDLSGLEYGGLDPDGSGLMNASAAVYAVEIISA